MTVNKNYFKMAKEKSPTNQIKRLEYQYFRCSGNERKQHSLQQRILAIKNRK